ncbi:MAG TPA: DUF916 domain-containing protein [Patescibacteria group bacterium]|nr:DUF916 domain-containing protein [Patescibacteria group bacterium]
MKRLFIIVPLFAVVALGTFFFFHQYVVTAQVAGQGLEVSPPSQEVIIDPGTTKTIKAKLTNKSDSTLPIEVRIEDFTAKGNEGQIELTTTSDYSVSSWTDLSTNSFTLAPGEAREVTATITAPSDAAGSRFGSFVFAIKADDQPGAASISQQIASLFLVKISGPVDEKLNIISFSAPMFSEFSPVTFAINFGNEGNVYSKARGLVNVTDTFGNKVADVVVDETNIFPGAERIVNATLDNQFLIGKYTATALIYYGEDNTNLTATTTFFVFPLRIAAVVIAVLFVLYFLRKRLKKAGKALFG